MALDKALLDQLLAGREPQHLFAKGGLIDDLKKALSERMLAGRLRKARKPRGLTFITRQSRSTGKAPRCSSTNLNLTAFGSRRTGWLFLGCPSPPSGYGPHDEVVHSRAQGHGPQPKPRPCHDARSPIYSGSKSQPQGHPQPSAAKARWSALFAPLLCEIHPS